MASCPNLSISPYKELVAEYGPGAANAVSVLLDSPEFAQWYGSDQLPAINNLQIVNSKGETFDVDKFLRERKKLVAQENGLGKSYQHEQVAQQVAAVFNQTNQAAKQYEAVVKQKMSGYVTGLQWRKEAKQPAEPIAFSQAPQTTQQVTDQKSEFQKMVDGVRVALQERIDRKRGQLLDATDAKYAKGVAELERLNKAMENVDAAQGIGLVIDEVHTKLLGVDGKAGVVEQVQKVAEKLEKGLADKSLSQEQMLEKITQLREFQQYVKDFSSLQDFYYLLPGATQNPEPGSPQHKLEQIYRAQQRIQEVYHKALLPLQARMLLPHLSKAGVKAAEGLSTSLRAIENKLSVAEARGDATSVKRLSKQRDQKLTQLKNVVGDEEGMLELLRSTSRDTSLMQYWFGTVTGSADAVLGTFSLFIKEYRTKLDRKLQALGLEALKELDLFSQATGRGKTDPAKFNEGLYEVVTNSRGEKSVHFVREIDWNSYYAAQAAFYESVEGLSPEEYYQQKALWYSQNREPLPQEEIDKRIAEKATQLRNGVITQEEYAEWVGKTQHINPLFPETVEYIGELSQPRLRKYTNPKWVELNKPENAAQKRYYDFLRKLMDWADSLLPVERRLGSRLPSIRQGLTDNLLQGTLTKELLWERLKGNFTADEYQDQLTYGVEGDVVPVKFTGKLDADLVSRDLLSSVLLFTQAAETYQQNTQLLPFAQSMLETVEQRDIQATNGAGEKLLRSGAKKLGLKVTATKGEGGNSYKLLEHFIDTNLLGKEADKYTVDIPVLGKVDGGKVVGAVMGLASKTQIGGPFNWLKSATNWISANVSVALEALSGEFLSKKGWWNGKKLFWAYAGSVEAMRDFASPQSTSLMGQLIDYWSPIPEEFKDKFGRDISSSQLRRHMSMGTWFLGSKFGEMEAQHSMFLGMLWDIELQQNGKTIRGTEAYELDELGKLRLKEGVEWSEKEQQAFKNRLDAMSKRLHGVYNDFDKTVVAKHSLGRVLIMYKKFLEPGIKRRWAGHHVDQEMDAELEGYYRTLGRNLLTDWKETLDALWSGKDYTGQVLTPREVKNLRTAARELAVTFTFMSLAAVLAGMGDDDKELKENTAYQLALYQLMRQGSELGVYIPGAGASDQLRLFSTPSALTTTLERMLALSGQVMPWNIMEEYKQSSQFHKKGDSKTVAQLQALLGFNSADPEKVLSSFSRFY